ncbi:hypothetical protein [Roseisolibacter sp. H3M3-2]|uniref:hypothetical protein n=1 Tax=Roseisolibacter sp. H3M3-2 TaxID=3031323 RepID=UPI0023DC1161|nr:hypothetical protein [Roseisolibacter sp. H3M3-2]MDF1504114.1 hypothetical protein [Roseisolibacter sp. H3M3-2]
MSRRLAAGASAAALLALVRPAHAQTDFYNTDAGRPLTIEDAYPVERRALELQAAPLRLERALGGTYRWGIEPEMALGILPRTQVEVGLPLVYVDRGTSRTAGAAGVDVSVLHTLNVETLTVPALALSAGALLPAGPLGPDHAYGTLKAVATKTFSNARLHLNAQAAFGPGLSLASEGPVSGPVGGNTLELSRWLAGAAIDRTFPLRSLLVAVEAFARAPVVRGEEVEWNAGLGTRWQAAPRWTLDAGAGRHLTGDDRGWYVTAGAAFSVGLPWRAR